MYPQNHRFIGNPLNLAIAPKNYHFFKENMNFWERLFNAAVTHHSIYSYDERAYKQDALIKKYLGPDMPSYRELEKTVSMILTNSHYSIHGVQSKTPAHVEIAGIHIRDENVTIPSVNFLIKNIF